MIAKEPNSTVACALDVALDSFLKSFGETVIGRGNCQQHVTLTVEFYLLSHNQQLGRLLPIPFRLLELTQNPLRSLTLAAPPNFLYSLDRKRGGRGDVPHHVVTKMGSIRGPVLSPNCSCFDEPADAKFA